jgi:hypothetical protein
VSYDFDRRMEARRGIMAHLDLVPTEDEATGLFEELRATLLACSRCTAPDHCLSWQKTACAGMPPRCPAREAFARLEAARDQLRTPERLRRCA